MGKVFITDEVNDTYTADVRSDGAVKVHESYTEYGIPSGTATAAISSSACYLHTLFVGASAASSNLWLFDSSDTANAIGTTASAVARIDLQALGPGTHLFDLYCDAGLTYRLSGADHSGLTITYRA